MTDQNSIQSILSYLSPYSVTFHSCRDSLLFGKTIVNTLRYNTRIRSGRALGSRLEDYLRATSRNGNSSLIPKGAHTIRVSNVMNIGGVMSHDVYSMSVTYTDGGTARQRNLVLKTYRPQNIDPVLKAYVHDEDLRRCVREFQALRSLGRVGFPVPEAYLCECDSSFLGYPFVIMQKEEVMQESSYDLDCFAATLAHLHNLSVPKLGIDVLKSPKDGCAYAKRWPLQFRHHLNVETKHEKRLKEKFYLAIQWLESKAARNSCPQYCLVHGDYHPANVFITRDSRTIVLDWESVEIGDPAFDVAYAYHFIKFFSNPLNPNSAELRAERFISEYMKNFNGPISGRLEFYKVVAIVYIAIQCSAGLSSFAKAYSYHRRQVLPTLPFLSGLLIFLGFPFIRWSYVARRLGALNDIYWLKYFENFFEKNIK